MTPPARRLGFRFLSSYLLLSGLQLAAGWVPGAGWLLGWYSALWRAVVPWVARRVLGLGEIATAPTGSSDRTFDSVQALCLLALAAAAAAVWTAMDRRQDDRPLREWMRIFARAVLVLFLLSHGLGLVLQTQFPPLSSARLAQRLGDSTPLGLLAAFFGYSAPYSAFAGGGELLAAALLLFRRTTTLGALLALGTLSDLAMLAFSYDLPLKLASLHLLAFAAFLLAPDLRRLAGALLLDRPTEPADLGAPPVPERWARALPIVKALAVAFAVTAAAKHHLDLRRTPERTALEEEGYFLMHRGFQLLNDDTVNR